LPRPAYELRLAAIHQTTAIAFIELDSEIAFDGDFMFTVDVNVDSDQRVMSQSDALIGSDKKRSVTETAGLINIELMNRRDGSEREDMHAKDRR
jgi:hypothetical protein